jgi:hypothetical protein
MEVIKIVKRHVFVIKKKFENFAKCDPDQDLEPELFSRSDPDPEYLVLGIHNTELR